MRVDDGGGLARRLRRVDSTIPSFFRYQGMVMPGAVERLRQALASPPGLPEEDVALSRCGLPETSYLETVSRLGCKITSYGEYRDNPDYSAAVRALAMNLNRQREPEENPPPESPVLPLAQRLEGLGESGSPLGSLTLAEYFQGLAILGRSSFVLWLYRQSILPRTLKGLKLHLGVTLGELCRAAARYYTEAFQNDVFYALLIQPVAAIAPDPDCIPRLQRAASRPA